LASELVISRQIAIDTSCAENISVYFFTLRTPVNVAVETHSVVPAPEEAGGAVLAEELVVELRKFSVILVFNWD